MVKAVSNKAPAARGKIVRKPNKGKSLQEFINHSLEQLRAMYHSNPDGLGRSQIMALAKAKFRHVMLGLIDYLIENRIIEKFRRHGTTDCYRLIGEIPKSVSEFQFATAR